MKFFTAFTAISSILCGLILFVVVAKLRDVFADMDVVLPNITRILCNTHGAIAAVPLILCGLMTGMTCFGPPQPGNRPVLISNVLILLGVVPFVIFALYLPFLHSAATP